jgi:hypothetical protein
MASSGTTDRHRAAQTGRGHLGCVRDRVEVPAHGRACGRRAAKKAHRLRLPRRRPTRNHLERWRTHLAEHVDVVRDSCRNQAVAQAIEAGCFNGHGTLNNPGLPNIMFADGTVVAPPVGGEVAEAWAARGKAINTGLYKENGEKGASFATGTKIVFFGVRTHLGRNCRITLDAAGLPPGKSSERRAGYNGEAGLATRMALALADHIHDAGGSAHFVSYDAALRGVNLDLLLKKGYTVLSPVHATAAGREPLKQIGECPCGTVHDLNTTNGDIWEARLLDTGEQHDQRCQRKRLEKRPHKNACSWFVEIRLSCGNTKHIRIDHDDKDADKRSNRVERLRQHPPGSPLYELMYGRREESESVHNILDNTLHLGRMIAHTASKQLLAMLGFMLARNTFARYAHKQHANSPPAQR